MKISSRTNVPWLSPQSAARYADVSRKTIYTWCQQGMRHSRLTTGTIRIKTEWVDEWIEGQSQVNLDDILEGIA